MKDSSHINIRQVSVTSGAILAGASDDDIKQCEIFATKIGLAFQSEYAFVFISGSHVFVKACT